MTETASNFADASINLYCIMVVIIFAAILLIHIELKKWCKQIDRKYKDFKGPIEKEKDNEKEN